MYRISHFHENNYFQEYTPTKQKIDYSMGIVIPFYESILQIKRALNEFFVLYGWQCMYVSRGANMAAHKLANLAKMNVMEKIRWRKL